MYSLEQRRVAIETFIKFGYSYADTIAELGYPNRQSRSCCLMAAIIAPSYFQTPCSGGFFIFRAWKPPAPMAPDPTESLPIPWANRGNVPD